MGFFSDFSARLPGLKIQARFSSARAELRTGLNRSPCNRQFVFKRICFRSRAVNSARLTELKFAMKSGPKFSTVIKIPYIYIFVGHDVLPCKIID